MSCGVGRGARVCDGWHCPVDLSTCRLADPLTGSMLLLLCGEGVGGCGRGVVCWRRTLQVAHPQSTSCLFQKATPPCTHPPWCGQAVARWLPPLLALLSELRL